MRTILILAACLWAKPVWALATNQPPGRNFDLSHWYLTLPVDSSGGTSGTAVDISAAQLTAGYTNAAFFYTGADGAMVFYCPATGATTSGSSNPRTELREQLNTNDNSVDWTAEGMSVLSGQCKVTAVAPGGELAIAQMHGYSVDIPFLLLYYDNSQGLGTIAATIKYKTNNAAINGSTDHLLTFANVGLGNLISYRIVASDGVVAITVNGQTQSQNFYATDTNWAKVSFYFKAGDYYTDNGGTTRPSQVSYYQLTASHRPVFDSLLRSGRYLIADGDSILSGSNYYVLASTNLGLPLSQWTPVATNKFDSNGNFHFTNVPGAARQQFYIIKLR